jgi:hypothetical protein
MASILLVVALVVYFLSGVAVGRCLRDGLRR